MSAMMARQRGRVQLEQSDLRLALNMGKMAKERILRAAIEKTQYLTKKPLAKVQEENTHGVEFPGHIKVKAAIEIHPAMLCQNHTTGCLSCQNGTAKTLQTHWKCNGTGPPPPQRRRQPTPEPTPPLPRVPPAPTGNNSGAKHSYILNLPARYAYSHRSLPWA